MSEFEKYKSEAEAKWGDTDAFVDCAEKTKDYSKDKWESIADEIGDIISQFAECMKKGEKPESDKAQRLVKALQEYITENLYNCTNEILSILGKMYISDERFKKNFDKHGEGNAEFVCRAIEVYCG